MLTPRERVANFSDAYLKECVQEVIQWHKTGRLPEESVIRELAASKLFREVDLSETIGMLEQLVVMEAATRWVDSVPVQVPNNGHARPKA